MLYGICWKCNGEILRNKDRYYIKSKDGNYEFCSNCYKNLLELNKDFFQFNKSKEKELYSSFTSAIEGFHNEMVEERKPIWMNNLPSVLIHTAVWWSDCSVCLEMLKVAQKNLDKIIKELEKCIEVNEKNIEE